MSHDEFTDNDLAGLAAASQERIEPTDEAPTPAPVSASLGDVMAAARRARELAEASPAPVPTDAQERHLRLKAVLEQLPAGMHRATRQELEGRVEPRLLKAALGWRWGAGNLVLMGATGAGKTSAAAHLVRRLCFEGAVHGGEAFGRAQLIRWQSCRELSEIAREMRLGAGEPETIVRCKYARLLVLNDLGISDDRATLERILDQRYERGWPTVTTTGLGTSELGKMLGDALFRRIFECGKDRGLFVEIKRAAS